MRMRFLLLGFLLVSLFASVGCLHERRAYRHCPPEPRCCPQQAYLPPMQVSAGCCPPPPCCP